MKKMLLALTLFALLVVIQMDVCSAEEQSKKISYKPTPMDGHWFVKTGGRYLVTCTNAEMAIVQQKYPTLQCYHQVNINSSSSVYSISIPEDFSDVLLEQLKKENINISAPRKVFPTTT
jgi:hypothetical protein